MYPQHLACTFFQIKDNKLSILGNTLDDIKKTWNYLKTDIKHGLFGENGALATLFNGKNQKNISKPELRSPFEAFEEKFNHSALSAETLAEEIGNIDSSIVNYAKTCKNGELTTKGFNASLESQTFAAKASSAALKGLALAGNMVAGILITQAISFAIKKISDFANASEIARENAEQYAQSISESMSSTGSNSKKIKSLNDELQVLSDGVTATGQNISLSASEYGRYKEIISEISEIMPGLTTYFNAQGEKIGFVKGKLKDANKEYREQIRLQAQASITGSENQQAIKDAVATYKEKDDKGLWASIWNSFKAGWGSIDENSLETSKIIKGLEDIYNVPQEEVANALEIIYADPVLDDYKLPRILGKMLETSPDEIRKMTGEEFNVLQQSIKANIDYLNAGIESDLSVNKNILQQFVNSSSGFSNIEDENVRNNITTFISSLTSGMFDQFDIEEDTAIADFQRLANKIISVMSGNGKVSKAWEELFKLDPGKLNTEEYISKIKSHISTLCNEFGISDIRTQKGFTLSLGLDIEEYQSSKNALNTKLDGIDDAARNKILNTLSASELADAVNPDIIDWSKIIPYGFGKTADEIADIVINNIRNSLKEKSRDIAGYAIVSFSEAWNNLKNTTDDNYKNIVPGLLELSNSGTLTPESLKSVENYNILLKKTGLTAEEAVKEIYKLKDTDFTSMLASMRSGISSISGILTTKKDNLSDKKTITQGISADTLAGMPDELKKCRKEYQKFANTLGNGSSSMDECQKAADNLATAYVNSNYFLEKLDNSNKNTAASMLKEMGIANADQIVTDALARKKTDLMLTTYSLADGISNTECAALSSETSWLAAASENTRAYCLQKIIANQTAIQTSESINNLASLVSQLGLTGVALEKFQAYKAAVDNYNNAVSNGDYMDSRKMAELSQKAKEAKKAFEKSLNAKAPAKIQVNGHAGSGSSSKGSNSKGSSPKTKETKQEIDWLQRAIDVTTSKINLLKSKLGNIFTVKKSNKVLKAQINETDRLITNLGKKIKKYKKKADNVNLPAKLKKQVRDGKIKGSYKQLAKTYGNSKAKKIKKYDNNYTKYQAAKKLKNKAVQKKESLKQQYNNSSTLEKRNANIGQQIKLSKELEKTYAKAEKTYTAKAGSIKLDKKLKKLVRNGQVKGSHKELVKQYGEETASKIEKYKGYYEKSQEARKSRQETKTQTRELKEQQHQNRIDDAEAHIGKLNAQAENKTEAKDKNKYLEKSVKWTKISYNQQIKIAQLEKDSVKAAQLKAEKKKALLDIEVQQHQNLQDEYDSYVSLYSAEEESGKTAKDKEASLKKQIKYTKKSYKEQINIAKAEGNTALKKQLQIEKQQELISLDTQILQNYADEHNASAALASTQAKTATSAKEKNGYERKALENTIQEYKYLYQIAKLKGDTVEMARLEAEIQDTANDSAKTQIDNISTEYQRKLDEIDRKTKSINHQASLVEAKNGFITAEMYEETVKSEKEHLEILKQEKTELEENFKNVKAGSSQWYEMRDIIYSVDEAIQGTNESIAGNIQKIRDAKRELEDLGRGVIDGFNSEAEFYEKILSYKDMFDNGTGVITKEGSSTLALHAFKATNSISQNKITQGQIEQLDKEYLSGTSSMAFRDYYERRKELLEQQRGYIENCYEEMEAIKELCSEGYEKQKDAMEKLADKYKKALQAEKNLRDYQNKIADKTEDIASIKKQIAALKGNMTEEARAKIQKLEVQLNDAEKDLEETEYEKYINGQEEILDNILEEFESFIDRQLSDMEGLIGRIINDMPANASIVNNTLNEIAGMWGITLSEALDSSTLSGSYSTIADKASETALIADSIYKAIIGNYSVTGSVLSSLSSDIQQMLYWLDTHNFTTDIEEAIKNTKDYKPENYDNIQNNKPDITSPDTENTWDSGNSKDENLEKNIRSMLNVIGKDVYGTDKAGNNWTDRISTDGLSQMLYENTGKILDDEMVLGLAQMLGVKTNGMTSGNIADALESGGYNSGAYGQLRNNIATELSRQLGWTEHTTKLALQGSASMGNHVQNQTGGTDSTLSKISNYISTSSRKPEGSEKMALAYDPLNSYIYSRTGKILNDENRSAVLAGMLGIDTSTPQAEWKKKAADALKGTGYSEGGIAETLRTVPGRTGDDGWCVVQKGETILNLEQTEMFRDLITKLPVLSMAADMIPTGLQTPSYNAITNNDSSVSIGDMVFNIDGNKIYDLESLKKEIQHDNKFRNFMTDIVLGKVTGHNYAHMNY